MSKPFQGLTFCCTAIPIKLREDISQKLTALGGIHYSDLMSDVNYLIVGDRKTEKYIYCVQNRFDVKFLKPDAILKIYDHWINGEDTTHLLDIENYLLPIFDNLSICLSRVESFEHLLKKEFRQEFSGIDFTTERMIQLISDNGGKATDSLTMSNSCIITTEKTGKRYTKAVEWGIPVIHPVWIIDSVLRLAALHFRDYTLDSRLNGCNVWDELFKYKTKNDLVDDKIDEKSTTVDTSNKSLKKDPKIWNEIMNKTNKTRLKPAKDTTWDEVMEEEEHEPLDIEINDLPNKHTATKKSTLFEDLDFYVVGFNTHETTVMNQIITFHSGTINEDSSNQTITHVVLPVKIGSQSSTLLKNLPLKSRINNGEIKIVTEWFIERSIYYNTMVMDRWCQPLKGLKPCTKKFKVCITGFTGIELLHLEKLINLLNFEFCPALTSSRDLLIININLFKSTLLKNSPKLYQYKAIDFVNCPVYQSGNSSVSLISSKNKINAAKNWSIPIVSIAYIWEILERSTPSTIHNLVLPDICDLLWCLFAPNNTAKPKTLLDYIKNLSNDSFETPKKDDKVKLPSPRKGKQKRKYGRLAGRDSPEPISKKLQKLNDNEKSSEQENSDNDVTNIDEDLTQVGYQDTDSLRNNEQLIRKLTGLK